MKTKYFKQIFMGKTLLFLDSCRYSCAAIEQAKAYGIRIVVANNHPKETEVGKQIADVSVDIDFSDIDGMVQLIKDERIDGIMAPWSDSYLIKYAEICEKAGLPCYGSSRLFDLFTQKKKYKELLKQYGIPVVEDYSLDDALDETVINQITYPVLVKPSDGSGSRGIRVCHNREELIEGYFYAKQYSDCGDIIVEKYLDGDEVVAYWYIQDGKANLISFGNWHKMKLYEDRNEMGIGFTYPSRYLGDYLRDVAPNVGKMAEEVGITQGPLFFQCFVDQGKAKVYDLGFRMTGYETFVISDAIDGSYSMERMMEFALTGSVRTDVAPYVDPHLGRKYGWKVTFYAKPGKIRTISGADEIEVLPYVVKVVWTHSAGEEIKENEIGQLSQQVCGVMGYSDSIHDVKKDMREIYRKLQIRSDKGEDMLLIPEEIYESIDVEGVLEPKSTDSDSAR